MVHPTVELEALLDGISRKFIRRAARETPQGYTDISELSSDMSDAIDTLLHLDPANSPSAANSEYWIRTANDFVTYVEDWPYATIAIIRPSADTSIEQVSRQFDSELVSRASLFTQTQRTRLLSLAMRLRQATQKHLLASTIDAFGESLG